jgi:hypothetical protein
MLNCALFTISKHFCPKENEFEDNNTYIFSLKTKNWFLAVFTVKDAYFNT